MLPSAVEPLEATALCSASLQPGSASTAAVTGRAKGLIKPDNVTVVISRFEMSHR